MAEFQSARGKLPVILCECLTLLFQLMVFSYFDGLLSGISFLWFKKVLESEQYDAVVPLLKNEKSMHGRDRIRQRVEEWGSLLGGTRSVRKCVAEYKYGDE